MPLYPATASSNTPQKDSDNPILSASQPIFASLLSVKRNLDPPLNAAALQAYYQQHIQLLQQQMQALHCQQQIIESYTYLMYRLIDLSIQDNPQLSSAIQPWQDNYFSQTHCTAKTRDNLYKVFFSAIEQIEQQRAFLEACHLLLKMIQNHRFASHDPDIERLLMNLESQVMPSPQPSNNFLPQVPRTNNGYRYLQIRRYKYVYLTSIAVTASLVFLAGLWSQSQMPVPNTAASHLELSATQTSSAHTTVPKFNIKPDNSTKNNLPANNLPTQAINPAPSTQPQQDTPRDAL